MNTDRLKELLDDYTEACRELDAITRRIDGILGCTHAVLTDPEEEIWRDDERDR